MNELECHRREPLIAQLDRLGVELDQRLSAALSLCLRWDYTDATVFRALLKMNAISANTLNLSAEQDKRGADNNSCDFDGYLQNHSIYEIHAGQDRATQDVWQRAFEKRASANTLGVLDFLNAIVSLASEHGDSFPERPFTLDYLCDAFGESGTAPISKIPQVQRLLTAIESHIDGAEDFQFVMMLHHGHLLFRPVSILGDFVTKSTRSGLLLPQRALLTHFKDTFGFFTQDEIEELEELINNPKSHEADFQRFFECHSHFFRRWDYREIFTQVHLSRPEGDLIPDFILTDRDLQKAAIVELKLPKPKLVVRQDNRIRFASAIQEARAQLLAYRNWFRDRNNRESLVNKVGMEVYEPHLAVVIGRGSSFLSPIDRQELQSSCADIEIVTYDDIVTHAARRRLLMEYR